MRKHKKKFETITIPALFEGKCATDKDIYPDFCHLSIAEVQGDCKILKRDVLQPD